MYASAAWLLWVLTRQTGEQGLRMALAGALAIGFFAWLYGIARGAGHVWWPRGLALACVAGLVALALPLRAIEAPDLASAASTSEHFSAQRLAELRRAGKPVFVNMTAAWCITCLVNERTTLSSPEVQQTMQRLGVTYLKGDWTRQDPEITAYLQSFQRDGVPFYAFYPANGAEPAVLPSVLTRTIVLDEIQRGSRVAPVALSASR
jgi:thiol:disulfide interchange protein DsbD